MWRRKHYLQEGLHTKGPQISTCWEWLPQRVQSERGSKGGGVQKAREREDPYAMLKNLNNQEDDGDSKKGFNNRKEMYFLKTILGKNVKDKWEDKLSVMDIREVTESF